MEIVGQSLADRAATVVVDGTLQQFRYMLDYKENMSNLRHKLHDLQNAKVRVGHQVDEATRGLEEIEGDVLTWISRADVAILNVESILAEDGVASNTCCAGRLPNFKNRYKLSKQAKVEAPVISQLAEKGAKFNRMERGSTPGDLVLFDGCGLQMGANDDPEVKSSVLVQMEDGKLELDRGG